jgi:putative tricarboxylic transport membrane protein
MKQSIQERRVIMTRRDKRLIGSLMTLFFLIGILFAAGAQAADIKKPADFPKRKIEWNLWYGPGGGTDIFSRTIGIPARRYLSPAPLVIINIPGAAGANGMIYTMEQPADGYTITSIGNDLPINDVLKRAKFQGKPLTIDDFVPIIRCQYDTATIQVSAKKSKSQGKAFKNIKDFVKFAKDNPGKVTIGGTGSAGFDEVVVAMFLKAAGIEAKYVPFDSAGKMHAQVLGGHIDAMFEEFGSTISLLEKGDIKALIVFKEDRVKDKRFSKIPSAPELGYDVTLGRWRGIGAKAGTPPDRIEYLHQVFKKAMGHSVYKNMEKNLLLDLRPGYMGPKELAELIKKEREAFSNVLKGLGYIK